MMSIRSCCKLRWRSLYSRSNRSLLSGAPSCSVPSNGSFPICYSGSQWGQASNRRGPGSIDGDAFISKFNSVGKLEWSTFSAAGGKM